MREVGGVQLPEVEGSLGASLQDQLMLIASPKQRARLERRRAMVETSQKAWEEERDKDTTGK